MYLTGNRFLKPAPEERIDSNSVMDRPTSTRTSNDKSEAERPHEWAPEASRARVILQVTSMFLVAIVCSRFASASSSSTSQTHFFQQPISQLRHPSSTRHYLSQQHPLNAPQRQVLEHLMRVDANFHRSGPPQQHQQQRQPSSRTPNRAHQQRPPATHQPPSDRRASGGGDSSTDQQASSGAGRLLVCYYTTKSAPPYWPNDAQGYVIPADQVAGFPPVLAASASVVAGATEPRQAPESSGFLPIGVDRQQVLYEPRGLHQANEIGKGKVVFKSIHSAAFSEPGQSADTISELVPHQALTMGNAGELLMLSNNENGAAKSNKHLFEQVFSSSKQHNNNYNRLQPSSQQSSMLVFAGAPNSNNKLSKQPLTAYSLLNGIETSSEVSSGGVAELPGGSRTSTSAAANQVTTTTTSQSSRGNNGFAAKLDAVYQQHHLERASKQEPQLMLSPSLSRAFIVGGSANNNNEVLLETKSQLFIPGGQQQAASMVQADQQKQVNVNYLRQQQTGGLTSSTAVSRAPALPTTTTNVHTKPLPVITGPSDQMSPVDVLFSGTVSSGLPVLLSPASTSALRSLQQQQQQFLPSNHMIQQQLIMASDRYSKPTDELPPPMMLASINKMSSNTSGSGHSTAASSLSSSLISSPLSSVLDAFGAASQYLMRFKPSSLISPSSFMFNTLAASNAVTNHLPGLRLNGDSNVSSTASLISLPSSLVIGPSSSQQQLKLQSAVSGGTGRSAASENSSPREQSGGGFLSRFSVLHGNNQRREDGE